MSSRAHVLDVNYGLGHDFALDVEVEVVNVRIPNALRKDNSGQDCLVRIARIPALDVAMVLGL